ncbi:MAG TPA: uroporphyrinogen-III C-methyltransferase [Acidimicrobiales bacterium]|jgi:uroporphyrin-III C-methyltransferase|nr:uroporphyrinogen-III C-methyltransferase [Acidimicrobiales bacterium]
MTVFLVGAGPGDPDLLTVRAARLLATADVVVMDRLVDRRVLEGIRHGALVIDVGKSAHDGASWKQQTAINELLVTHGRAGALVVRLKGGDPYLFGRGAEELAALVDAGVAVEVVPGITSALGVPALAGIPATLRGVSSSVTIVSGHRADDVAMQWEHVAHAEGTLVLLMAVANRGRIAERLMAAGLSPSTPVAAIERGSTPLERRSVSTLEALGELDVEAPAVIVVGRVAECLVALRSSPASPAIASRPS